MTLWPHPTTPPQSDINSYPYGVRILVIYLGHALPLAIHLQQQQIVCEINAAAPLLLQDAHDGECLFYSYHVYTRFERITRADSIDVAVELLYRPILQLPVEIADSTAS